MSDRSSAKSWKYVWKTACHFVHLLEYGVHRGEWWGKDSRVQLVWKVSGVVLHTEGWAGK